MKTIPTQVSESVRRRNPHLYGYDEKVRKFGQGYVDEFCGQKPPPKRIRQSSKPLLNELEKRCLEHLNLHNKKVYSQSLTFRLANGVRYTPDFFCFEWVWQHETRAVAWEVKGPWFTDDAKVKIKLFAAAYPQILVLLVSEDKGTGMWLNQEVYP